MKLTVRSLVSTVACVGLSSFVVGAAFAQSDPQVGVWKLNVAKSTYSPGPGPKSGTTTIEAAGAGTKVVVDQVMADGSKRHYEFTTNYDGKDSPVTGNNPELDTVASHAHKPHHSADDCQERWKGRDHSGISRVE